MHFSIPDTQEIIDSAGNTYLGYNIHINGLFHCTVRYRQLHNLHEQIVKDFDVQLPPFPPKKLFPLTVNQQEERRLLLEEYIQAVGQNSSINCSELLTGFLLNAQEETLGVSLENEKLNIYFMNDCKITLLVSTREHSGQILKKICRHIKLPELYDSYFSLFITVLEEDGTLKYLRKLQNFESPMITQKNMRIIGHRVTFGKNYWDTEYDYELMHDPVGLDLLYIQASAEVDKGNIFVPDNLQERLKQLGERGEQKEYLKIVRSIKYYGYLQFAPCSCDYPEPGTKAVVAIGGNELSLRIYLQDEEREALFKVTRMRCWRVTTLHNPEANKDGDSSERNHELSFQYLVARNQLQWITISSGQAILMSVSLQAMIDELLLKSAGRGKSVPRPSRKSWTYITRDGHLRVLLNSSSPDDGIKEDDTDSTVRGETLVKKLVEKPPAVKARKPSDIMENYAFDTIGDDDL
ncbi:sorting nexin-17 [Orussus abietinus]|uniref:sorting nexin-17 n=1 Tax=Orussus abietinus TaxID=222816 RepID=UPI000625D55F|nr:sorting nexin-17 [Orussus abietinus]